ncbi:MAG: hypothetical protein Q9218_002104, partial [Villophora microphyllina]
EYVARLTDLEYVPQIYWAFYKHGRPTLDAPDVSTELSTGLCGETTQYQPLTQDKASALRRSGIFFKQELAGLWVFSKASADAKPLNKVLESTSEILRSGGLQRKSDCPTVFVPTQVSSRLTSVLAILSGTVTPGESNVDLGPPLIKNDSSDEDDSNSGAQRASALFGARKDYEKYSIIYRELIAAVTSSVMRSLAAADWLAVGFDSCLRFPNTPQPPRAIYSRKDEFEHLKLSVVWSPSGTLTVHGRSRRTTGFSRLSDLLSDDRPGGEHTINHGHPIFMVPSGARYYFTGTEGQVAGSVKTNREGKRRTLECLARQGMRFTTDITWVYLRSKGLRSLDHCLPHNHNGGLILWPACACLIQALESSPTQDDVLQRISLGTFVDPLTKVEQWFLGRTARAEAAEARRKEDAERRFKENRQAETIPEQTDDTTIDRIAQTSQYLSAQEASGIYPTPPDGMAALTQGSYEVHDTNGPNTTEAQGNAPSMKHAAELHSPDAASLEVDVQRRHSESHDLFGGLDTDMFEANDLTEADLNFFDEPDEVLDQMSLDAVPSNIQSKGSGTETRQPSSQERAPEIVHTNGSSNAEDDRTDTALQIANALGPTSKSDASPISPASDDLGDAASEATSANSSCRSDSSNHVLQTSIDGHEEKPASKEKRSTFNHVSPMTRVQNFDEKYRQQGIYAASSPKDLKASRPTQDNGALNSTLPRIGALPDSSGPSTISPDGMQDMAYVHRGRFPWDTDVVDTSSSESASAQEESKMSPNSSKKRKRASSMESDSPATPALSDRLNETASGDLSHTDTAAKGTSHYHQTLDDILDYLDDSPTATGNVYIGNDQAFIQVAQFVAEQRILQNGFMQCVSLSPKSCYDLHTSHQFKDSSAALKNAVEKVLPGAQPCNLKALLDLGLGHSLDASAKNQLNSPSQLRSRVAKNPGDALYKTQAPYLGVQRGKEPMEVLPPALYFWEELGLGPVQQDKNIVAYMIYPNNEPVRDAASAFLLTIGTCYQSCKFGRHVCGTQPGNHGEGLIPMPVSSADPQSVFKGLDEVCERLGTEIPITEADESIYVIYMVNPFNDETMLPHLCQAFLRLSTRYASRVESALQNRTREVILQIIPINFLVNCDRLTFPPPKAYVQLAFELYSRCDPAPHEDESMPPPYASRSAVRLAKHIPRAINFHLGSRSALPLAHDPCLHLAYSWDCDEQWLACAWTDSVGEIEWNAVYCLQDPAPDFWAAFSQTVQEILETTTDMLRPANMRRRVHIVKDSELYQRELEVWRVHSASIFHQQSVTVTMFSVNSHPPLSFPPQQPPSGYHFLPVNTSTSPQTPYDQVPTPDHSSPSVTAPRPVLSSTPTGASGFTDTDPSARLIDIVSETWAMISPIPATDPYLPPTKFVRVLTSGYLLKRAGPEDDDGLVPLGINLVSTDISKQADMNAASTKAHEKVMRELLGMYSDLATLARSRGLEEWKTGVLPWHLAAARKGKRAVRGCMRWGERRSL